MASVFQNCFLRIFSFEGGGPDGPDPGGPVDPDDCTGLDPICCEQNPDAIGCDDGGGDDDPCVDFVQLTTCGDECDDTGCCGGTTTTLQLTRGELRARCQLDNGEAPSCEMILPDCLTCDGGVKYSVGDTCKTQCCPSDQCLYIECTASETGCDKGPPQGCCESSTDVVAFVPEGDPCPDASDVDNPNGLDLFNTLTECINDGCVLEGTCPYWRCPGGTTNGTECTFVPVDLTALGITDCNDKPDIYVDPDTNQTWYATKFACENAGEAPCCIVTYYKCDTDSASTVCGSCNQYSVNDGTCDIPADGYEDDQCGGECPGTTTVYQCNNPSKGFCDTVPDFCIEDNPGGQGSTYYLESGVCNKTCCDPIVYWYCPVGVEGGECTTYLDDDCTPDSGNSGPNGELVFNTKAACEKSQNTYCCQPEPKEDNYTNINCESYDGNCAPTGECATPDNVGQIFTSQVECNASIPDCCNAYDNPTPLVNYVADLLSSATDQTRPLFYCDGQFTTPFKIELNNELGSEYQQLGYSKLSDFNFSINGQQPEIVTPAGVELIRWDFNIPTANPSISYFVTFSDCDSTLYNNIISFSLNNCLDSVINYNACNNLTNGNTAPYAGQFPCAAGSICDTPLGAGLGICDTDPIGTAPGGVIGQYETIVCPTYKCLEDGCVDAGTTTISVFPGDSCLDYLNNQISDNLYIGSCGESDVCPDPGGGGGGSGPIAGDGTPRPDPGQTDTGSEVNNRLGSNRLQQVALDYLQNLNRVYEEDKLFDVAASNKKFRNSNRRFMPMQNNKHLDIFSKFVHASVWAILNTTENQAFMYERSFDDIPLDYLNRSLNTQLREQINRLKDYEGSPLRKKILSRLRRLLISNRLDEFDITGIADIDADHETYIRSSSISNENKLINLINTKAKPLNPEVYGGVTKEQVGLWKTVAPDLQKAIAYVDSDSVLNFIDIKIDDSYKVYYADGTSFTSYIKDGDLISYIDTKGALSYLDLDTLIEKAVMLDFEDAKKAFAYINEDYATTLEVESDEESLIEETYDLSSPRESFYFLKLHPETIEDADRTNPLVRVTTATFELLTDEEEINDWIEFKPWPYLHYYMDSSDPFFDHLLDSNQLSATFKDISFDKFVGYSQDVPVTPRRIPWYIIIVPTDRTRYLIGSGRSVLTGYNSRKAIFRISPSKKDVKQRWDSEIYDMEETEFYEGIDPRVQKNSLKVRFNKNKIKMKKVLFKDGEEKLPRKPSAARVLFNAMKQAKDDGTEFVDEEGETVAWASVYKKLTPFQRKEISSDIQNFKTVKNKISNNTFAKSDAVKERFPKLSDVLDQKLDNVTSYEKPEIITRARKLDIDPEAETPEPL